MNECPGATFYANSTYDSVMCPLHVPLNRGMIIENHILGQELLVTQKGSFYRLLTLKTTSLKESHIFFRESLFFFVELNVVSKFPFSEMLSSPNYNLCVRTTQRFILLFLLFWCPGTCRKDALGLLVFLPQRVLF